MPMHHYTFPVIGWFFFFLKCSKHGEDIFFSFFPRARTVDKWTPVTEPAGRGPSNWSKDSIAFISPHRGLCPPVNRRKAFLLMLAGPSSLGAWFLFGKLARPIRVFSQFRCHSPPWLTTRVSPTDFNRISKHRITTCLTLKRRLLRSVILRTAKRAQRDVLELSDIIPVPFSALSR